MLRIINNNITTNSNNIFKSIIGLASNSNSNSSLHNGLGYNISKYFNYNNISNSNNSNNINSILSTTVLFNRSNNNSIFNNGFRSDDNYNDSGDVGVRYYAFRKRESKKKLNKIKSNDNNRDRGAKRQPKQRPKLQSMKVSRDLDTQEKLIEDKMNELEDRITENKKSSRSRKSNSNNNNDSDENIKSNKPSTSYKPRRGRVKISFDFLNEKNESEQQQPEQEQVEDVLLEGEVDEENQLNIKNQEVLIPKVPRKSKIISTTTSTTSTTATPTTSKTKKEKIKKEKDEVDNDDDDDEDDEPNQVQLILESRKKEENSVLCDDGKSVATKVVEDLDGMRVDRWVSNHYPVITHSLLCKWIRSNKISVSDSLNGERKQVELNDRLVTGQWVNVPMKALKEQRLADRKEPTKYARLSDEEIKEIRDSVLYKDDQLLIINKPQGLSVQGGTGLKKHLDMMMSHLKFELEEAPRLCHRLDRETSGILILARTRKAATAMADKFEMKLKRRTTRQDRDKKDKQKKDGSGSGSSSKKDKDRSGGEDEELRDDNGIRKTYWALLTSTPNPKEGRIRAPLKKVVQDGEEMVIATKETGDGAKLAITEYKVVESSLTNASFVSLWPETGRTHQLRVHCASILSSPIVGDKKYGKNDSVAFQSVLGKKIPLHLHARRVEFFHPETNKKIDVVAPLPKNLENSWDMLGFTAHDTK
ncbi:Probable ribosomal large subunit pseudouridine synthase C protein [Heterostelium album PN500]|uniref:Probable ribosomal large subunit pseudouridine synthase C protein n=1 Tax=Heterostelium pallidum (strain ATCC 26659 / Pp 5 / PN500) TaxID=670386 RepID=D3BJX8_HETP5|nr:Probable ribosomal large subunit pseudouridine synthase C protein [Heterostelium album PN500]EFA78208.1 Probable ribosomal large subunit pseudouridine synthase C protein [Heterostelium album PN500]|eukprot:XP_020430334.1 Probable ribosomal large subunit pseudouridine synthase C protein [Heterostelium album PN500]